VRSLVSSSRFQSARFQRIVFRVGALVLIAGVVALTIEFAGGSDKTSVKPDKGFRPTLPVKTHALRNHHGVTVHYYEQLDPEIKATIRRFIATAVERKHLGRAWDVIAPSMKHGYTKVTWAHAKALPVIPYPVGDVNRVSYWLREATDQEILLDAGVSAPERLKLKAVTFTIGLVPVGRGIHRWLVDYWMPRWDPILPEGN
jgi:hypothetical protein